MTRVAHRLVVVLFPVLLALACRPAASPPLPADGYLTLADSLQLYYRTAGSGRDTVVVVHGGPGLSSAYLAPDLQRLAVGRTLFFYDQRGSGRSAAVRDTAELGIDDHVGDLERLRERLGLQRLTLVGHSWGGGVAVRYALTHPDRVRRLLLIAPLPPRADPYADEFLNAVTAELDSVERLQLAALDQMLPTADDPGEVCRERFTILFQAYYVDSTAPDRSHGDICDIPPDALGRMETVNEAGLNSLDDYDWRELAPVLRAPVLVVHGAGDPLPLQGSREWVDLLPDARLLVIPGAGHFPYLEQPERFFPAADAFLRGE